MLEKAIKIVNNMYAADAFSQWLGIEIMEIGVGTCIISMTVRPEMVNGYGVAHGGITFSFADSAFAFASNSHGRKAVSIETSISHTRPVQVGDRLTAVAIELNLGNTIGIYQVVVKNQDNKTVALFKGNVFRSGEIM